MKLSLQAWGDDAALPLPKALMRRLCVAVGDTVEVSVIAGTLRLWKAERPHYTLAELLAQSEADQGSLPIIEEWEHMPAVGREKL